MQSTEPDRWVQTFKAVVALLLVGFGVTDIMAGLFPQLGVWRYVADAAIIILGLLILFSERRKAQRTRPSSLHPERVTQSTVASPDVLRITHPPRSNRLSPVFNVILYFLSFSVLIMGIVVTFITVQNNLHHTNAVSYARLLFFVLTYVVVPIFFIYTTAVTERRYNKSGHSAVFREATILYRAASIDDVFDRCYAILTAMKAQTDHPIRMERPHSLSVRHDLLQGIERFPTHITAIINRTDDPSQYEIKLTSDASRLDASIDFGHNKSNIEMFERLLLSQVGEGQDESPE